LDDGGTLPLDFTLDDDGENKLQSDMQGLKYIARDKGFKRTLQGTWNKKDIARDRDLNIPGDNLFGNVYIVFHHPAWFPEVHVGNLSTHVYPVAPSMSLTTC
jgi:hypothetical protein